MAFSIQKIQQALGDVHSRVIVVVGDYCLDKYFYSDPARDEASVETGLDAYQIHRKAVFAGVGGTITNNLRALGAQVRCVGTVGEDGEGWELLHVLEQIGADTTGMISTPHLMTSTYIKPMRKTPTGGYIEANRMDIRNFAPLPEDLQQQVQDNLLHAINGAHAVIVTDQFLERNCSVVTDNLRAAVSRLANEYPNLIFYADSRGFIHEYRNVIIKCNHLEAVRAILPEHQGEITQELLLDCGKQLAHRNQSPVVITRGHQGSLLFDGDRVSQVPAFAVEGPLDIVGAGDATNAGIVLGLCLGLSLEEAALLGNCVSSITIQQIGVTGKATVDQVQQRLASASYLQKEVMV